MRQLDSAGPLELLAVSRWCRTPPLANGSARGWFLNGVAIFDVAEPIGDLLSRCRRLEEAAGRRRVRHWADRPLDLDLLLAEGVTCDDATLTLPHPAIARRPFVLGPLLEVWPDAVDPTTGLRYADSPPAPGPQPTPRGVMLHRRQVDPTRGARG